MGNIAGRESMKLKCDNIEYRKGYIEISPNIHNGYVNIETWGVDADVDLKTLDIDDENFQDDFITANTEIEMSIDEVEALVVQLQSAINNARQNDKNT